MRISVNDILGWLASGMTINEILEDYDELNITDIYAALSYAADRENKIYQVAVWSFFSIKTFRIESFGINNQPRRSVPQYIRRSVPL